MARIRRLRLNLVGVVAILIGITGFAAQYIKELEVGPIPIAFIGIGVGVLAIVISLSSGRYGSGIPVLGLLISVGALGHAFAMQGRFNQWFNFNSHPSAAADTSSPKAQPMETTSVPQQEQRVDPKPSRDLFDVPSPANSGPLADQARSDPRLPTRPEPPVQTPVLPAQEPATPSIRAAQDGLDKAREAVRQSLAAKDPAYRVAKKDQDQAAELRKRASQDLGPQSQAFEEAQRQWDVDQKALNKLIDAACKIDPVYLAAQKELDAAIARQKSAAPHLKK